MDTLLAMQLPPTATNVTDIPSCESRQFHSVERAADAAMVEVLVEDFDWSVLDYMDEILDEAV